MYDSVVVAGNQPAYCFQNSGSHQLKGTFYDTLTKCANVLDFEILVNKKPEAIFSFSPEQPLESVDEVYFQAVSVPGQTVSYTWHFINNGIRMTGASPVYVFQSAGTFPLAMVVSTGPNCSDTLVKTITVAPDFNLYVPEAFTPNEDAVNEVFLPKGYNIAEYHLEIYNRWGVKVFESNDLSSGWDGSYNGQPAKSGAYVWRIEMSSFKGEHKNQTGQFTLYR